MTADLQNCDPTRIHYLQEESEDLDAVFRSNYVRNHTFYETKKKTLDNLALGGDEIVLDVGCGQGHFLKLLHRFYPNVKRIGIDINLKDLKSKKPKQRQKMRLSTM
jgi:cyclopropane fatty-acyl-phospholipid synthase-like methyltransferase